MRENVSCSGRSHRSPIPAKIQKLAADAYIWGVAPEFVYRFANYNELVTAPRQHVRWSGSGGGMEQPSHERRQRVGAIPERDARPQRAEAAAAAPRSSCSRSRRRRPTTTSSPCLMPSSTRWAASAPGRRRRRDAQTYLLAGPTSQYAHKRIARIHGFTYRVMPFDTNRGVDAHPDPRRLARAGERPRLRRLDPSRASSSASA